MKNPVRVTTALDEEIADLFEKMRVDLKLSQSELLRRALLFYHKHKVLHNSVTDKKIYTYLDMLPSGEHVILDLDHWLSFLSLVETSPGKDEFWKKHREIARSHAEQLSQKVKTVEDLLERIETCNFFKVIKDSENMFTLVLGSDVPKKFIRIFLEEVLAGMGYKVEIKEDLAKLRMGVIGG